MAYAPKINPDSLLDALKGDDELKRFCSMPFEEQVSVYEAVKNNPRWQEELERRGYRSAHGQSTIAAKIHKEIDRYEAALSTRQEKAKLAAVLATPLPDHEEINTWTEEQQRKFDERIERLKEIWRSRKGISRSSWDVNYWQG